MYYHVAIFHASLSGVVVVVVVVVVGGGGGAISTLSGVRTKKYDYY